MTGLNVPCPIAVPGPAEAKSNKNNIGGVLDDLEPLGGICLEQVLLLVKECPERVVGGGRRSC